jgi:hypothetical protein
MKTYWMSFADATTGENLGVCVITVSAEQAAEAVALVKCINPEGRCENGEEWTVAAVGQSLRMECNPGGGMQLTEVLDPSVLPADLPRNRLIRLEELQRNGWD